MPVQEDITSRGRPRLDPADKITYAETLASITGMDPLGADRDIFYLRQGTCHLCGRYAHVADLIADDIESTGAPSPAVPVCAGCAVTL